MSTTASASASARTQSEADELFRVASAEMAVTTCEVSSVGGGGGDRYAPLPHYQVEEVKKMWEDVTEEDMAKLLAIPDRLEERRDDVVAEDAKLAKKAQKRARREGEDELAIVRGGGVDGKLRALGADVPAPARATGSDIYRRSDGDGAGRGTDVSSTDERDGRGSNETDALARPRARVAPAADGGRHLRLFGPPRMADGRRILAIHAESIAEPTSFTLTTDADGARETIVVSPSLSIQVTRNKASVELDPTAAAPDLTSGEYVDCRGIRVSLEEQKTISKRIRYSSVSTRVQVADSKDRVDVECADATTTIFVAPSREIAQAWAKKRCAVWKRRGPLRVFKATENLPYTRVRKRRAADGRHPGEAVIVAEEDAYAYATRDNPTGLPVWCQTRTEAIRVASKYLRENVDILSDVTVGSFWRLIVGIPTEEPSRKPGERLWRWVARIPDDVAQDASVRTPPTEHTPPAYGSMTQLVLLERNGARTAPTPIAIKDVGVGDGLASSIDRDGAPIGPVVFVEQVKKSTAKIVRVVPRVFQPTTEFGGFEASCSTVLQWTSPQPFAYARDESQRGTRGGKPRVAFSTTVVQTIRGESHPRFRKYMTYAPSIVQEERLFVVDRERAEVEAARLCDKFPGAAVEVKKTNTSLTILVNTQIVGVVSFGPAIERRLLAGKVLTLETSAQPSYSETLQKCRNISHCAMGSIESIAQSENKRYEAFSEAMRLQRESQGESLVIGMRLAWGGCSLFERDVVPGFPTAASWLSVSSADVVEDMLGSFLGEEGRGHVADLYYVIGYWLGDGACAAPSLSVSHVEMQFLGPRLERIAENLGARITWHNRDGCSQGYFARSTCRVNIITAVLRALGIFRDKNISSECVRQLAGAHRDNRLSLLAGLIDSDGSRSFPAALTRGGGVSLSQNCENKARTHKGIVVLTAIIAQSLGGDVRYGEKFGRENPMSYSDGRFLRVADMRDANMPSRQQLWREQGHPRTLSARVEIVGVPDLQRHSSLPTKTGDMLEIREISAIDADAVELARGAAGYLTFECSSRAHDVFTLVGKTIEDTSQLRVVTTTGFLLPISE